MFAITITIVISFITITTIVITLIPILMMLSTGDLVKEAQMQQLLGPSVDIRHPESEFLRLINKHLTARTMKFASAGRLFHLQMPYFHSIFMLLRLHSHIDIR